MNDFQYISFGPFEIPTTPPKSYALDNTEATKQLTAAETAIGKCKRWRGGTFVPLRLSMRSDDLQTMAVCEGIQAGWEFRRRVLAALDLLDACDTAAPLDRRAALARVREVLEGER